MFESIDPKLVLWSRALFALIVFYLWFFAAFIPGLSFFISLSESLFISTKKSAWRDLSNFWKNFLALSLAFSGLMIILSLSFSGMIWPSFSRMAGSVFSFPLFLTALLMILLVGFAAIMFFGRDRVSRLFHLLSHWMVTLILIMICISFIAMNAWMQSPGGMRFNPEMLRFELTGLINLLFSPMTLKKVFHVISTSFVISAVLVMAVSSWQIVKNSRNTLARRGLVIALIFGFVSLFALGLSGIVSTREVAGKQKMKFAAMEGIYYGNNPAELDLLPLTHQPDDRFKEMGTDTSGMFRIVNRIVTIIMYGKGDTFVPGIIDLLEGNENQNILSAQIKIQRGKTVVNDLQQMMVAKTEGDLFIYEKIKSRFFNENYKREYLSYMGYGMLGDEAELIPEVALIFYSYHLMAIIGIYLLLFFILVFFLRKKWHVKSWLFYFTSASLVLCIAAGYAGWLVSEAGRQPWIIHELMTTSAGGSAIQAGTVHISFWIMAFFLTVMFLSSIYVMVRWLNGKNFLIKENNDA